MLQSPGVDPSGGLPLRRRSRGIHNRDSISDTVSLTFVVVAVFGTAVASATVNLLAFRTAEASLRRSRRAAEVVLKTARHDAETLLESAKRDAETLLESARQRAQETLRLAVPDPAIPKAGDGLTVSSD